ncbi:endospore germination permease [uncultured Clostridium sp.]|uniref:endospore germination permease n=1 Tax=uncultured Clostridium sp. TaxID=59620 RepID=UPI002607DFE7|nr:endospore germination permease [uncultured Clostridium sp.]
MIKITSKHFAFLIIAVTGISVKTYSSIFVRMGGRDTWICAIIASIIIFLFWLFILFVSKRRKALKMEEVFTSAFSKPIGTFLIILFCIGLFLTSLESVVVEASSMHTNIFLESPIWYCMIFFLIPASYVATRKLKTIVILSLIVVSIIAISNFILKLLVLQYKNFDYLFPILFNGFSKDIYISIIMIVGSFSSIMIILPFLRYVIDLENLFKNSIFGTLFILFFSCLVIFFIITSFGPLRAGNIFYPDFVQSQMVQVKGFIECGDLFFIIRCIWKLSLKYILSINAIYILFQSKIKNKNIFVLVYSLIIFSLSLYLGSNQFFLFTILGYLQLILLVLFFIIPLIAYIIFFFKTWKPK